MKTVLIALRKIKDIVISNVLKCLETTEMRTLSSEI